MPGIRRLDQKKEWVKPTPFFERLFIISMSFAISKPTNAGPQERTEEFQFTVGNVF